MINGLESVKASEYQLFLKKKANCNLIVEANTNIGYTIFH